MWRLLPVYRKKKKKKQKEKNAERKGGGGGRWSAGGCCAGNGRVCGWKVGVLAAGRRRTAADGAGGCGQRWTGRRKNEGKERRAWAEGIASVWRFYKANGKRKKERKREEENEGGKGRPAVWWR